MAISLLHTIAIEKYVPIERNMESEIADSLLNSSFHRIVRTKLSPSIERTILSMKINNVETWIHKQWLQGALSPGCYNQWLKAKLFIRAKYAPPWSNAMHLSAWFVPFHSNAIHFNWTLTLLLCTSTCYNASEPMIMQFLLRFVSTNCQAKCLRQKSHCGKPWPSASAFVCVALRQQQLRTNSFCHTHTHTHFQSRREMFERRRHCRNDIISNAKTTIERDASARSNERTEKCENANL